MRKMAKKIAYFLTVAACLPTAFFAVPKSAALTAHAQTTQTASNVQAEETTLISPSDYQQYLSLTNPMDAAACNGYMAIADENRIYVYDVSDGEYRKYEHTVNVSDPSKNNVMQVQFYGDDLYFLDGTFLYRLDPETLERSDVSIGAEYPKFPCSSFLIVEDALYYTNVKTTTAISCVTLDGAAEYTLDTVDGKPTIAFGGDELYYTDAGKYLRKVNPRTKEEKFVAVFSDDLVSMQIRNNVFICTTLGGDFYAYNLTELASEKDAAAIEPLARYTGNYTSLDLFGDYVYAVNSRSVRQYSLQDGAFTDFEICAASASPHRLDGGAESLLSHGKLFIADNGNSRISVYDTDAETFCAPISTNRPTDFAPVYLAGDENTLLAADQTTAVLYATTAENYGETLAAFDTFHGNLVGAANVYGKYYFVTDAGYYYVAEKRTDESAEPAADGWTVTGYEKTSTRTPALLTTDAYGYLYVASGTALYRFSEDTFLSTLFPEGEPYATLPAGTQKIAVDYNGDVYALANGKLQKAGGEPYPLNEPLVYSESATVAAFAFGIEDNATYLLYEENYLAKTGVLDLPTVKNIPVSGVDEGIFSQTTAAVEIVRLRTPAMVIDFTLNELSGAEVFPYENYSRRETPLAALKIGQTADGKHTLLAFYDEQARAYRSCLALTDDCIPLTEEEQTAYYVTYAQPKTMYASNEIPVYKFPHLSGLPTVTTLPRSAAISVLGEINDLDRSYYLVQYADGENVTHTGYVPKAYAVDFDPTPPTATERSYGATVSDTDAIWRLAFLLLGGAAILILIDVLIFRAMRPKKDD